MFSPNQILDRRYQVICEIARGGMGVIYRARDMQLQDDVALKVSLLYEDKFIEAFEREARILKSLRHIGLPQVRGYFSANDFLVFVMEYIEGESLVDLLNKREKKGFRGLPLDEVHNIAEQMSDILAYLHGKGVVHRDIKPENIKLMSTGQIILLDFGLAKDTTKSLHGGSLAYAAPEQISDQGTSQKSDIYSFGATLYHLLAGEMPTSAIFRLTDFHSSNLDSFKKVHEINPLIPEDISKLIAWAMELNPQSRPAGVADFRQIWRTTAQKYINTNFQTRENALTTDPTLVIADEPPKVTPEISNPMPDTIDLGYNEKPSPEKPIVAPNPLPENNIGVVSPISPSKIPEKQKISYLLPIAVFGGLLFLLLLGGGIFGAWQAGLFADKRGSIVVNNANANKPPSTGEVLNNSLKISLYLKEGEENKIVGANHIFKSGDKMHFILEPQNTGVLYVVVNDFVEKKLLLFYPNKRFPTSREILKGGKEIRYPPIQEIQFGKVDTKDRDYNADKFFFIFAPSAEDALIKEIEATLDEEKPLDMNNIQAQVLFSKLDDLASKTKVKQSDADFDKFSTRFETEDETIVGLIELKSAGK